MIKSVLEKVRMYVCRIVWSLEKQARHAGVQLGDDCFIASRFWSTEPYLISIGNHCAITAGVKMFTHGGARVARSLYPKFDTFGRVRIGDCVYIGTNALIMPGVTIGDNVLVAAGSVVTKSVPSNCVVAGNPARLICTLDEYIERNKRYNLNSKGMSMKEKRQLLESVSANKLVEKSVMPIPPSWGGKNQRAA